MSGPERSALQLMPIRATHRKATPQVNKTKAADQNSAVERRAFGRRTTFKRAVIKAADQSEISCVIVDISEGGARIELESPKLAPERFDLVVRSEDFAVKCEIVHRRSTTVGVRFIASPRRLSWGMGNRSEEEKELLRRLIGPSRLAARRQNV